MTWSIHLSAEEEAALDDFAAAEGRSRQEIVRAALRDYLMRHRRWCTPMFTAEESFDLGGPIRKSDIRRRGAD
ncbi:MULTISPECIES: CopG family transcriptional regulator [unclassified Nocardia]|uniref:ribbon-helix-helix domain-containing protein n=1 Tax=unclassified Nocardia TaxID=2637762 RepID=UPI001CE4A8D2|nr:MULTISPECIES: CopG family transcriptional regulator [unclassified Nocardia]